MSAKTFPKSRIAPGIGRLTVKGAPAPRNSGNVGAPGATARVNRPSSGLIAIDKSYQFILTKDGGDDDAATSGLPSSTAPVRKMEHLSRVRTANFGISTMDSPFMNPEDSDSFFRDKPHFVLCGLPVGAKAVDPHLYLNETRVGNFKTSARALYIARRPFKSGKARSEPISSPPTERGDFDDSEAPNVPPMPPVTPISFHGSAKTKRSGVSLSANGILHLEGHKYHTSSASHDWEFMSPHDLLMKQQKNNMMSKRSHTTEGLELQKEFKGLSSTHIQALSLNATPISNGLVGNRRFRHKIRPKSKSVKTVNYNNPYRTMKQQNKPTVISEKKQSAFDSLDSYVSYQKSNTHFHHGQNGKRQDVPKALVRVPKPCSDTFLLQMMYDMNRPKSRRSTTTSAKLSEGSVVNDFEEFVHTKTANSLAKTQTNIDRFSTGKKSAKSVRSFKSETITEEVPKDDDVSETA